MTRQIHLIFLSSKKRVYFIVMHRKNTVNVIPQEFLPLYGMKVPPLLPSIMRLQNALGPELGIMAANIIHDK